MKKIKYMLLLALLITGCDDMKMDRKVDKQITLTELMKLNLIGLS
jgi:PBP1b-binding outer membrane lipoprotein LpoB